MSFPTCSRCSHFRLFPGDKQGWCFGTMPVIFATGYESPNPPKVKANRPCCVGFDALPDSVATLEYGKVTPETPGDAVKQKQEQKAAQANTPDTSNKNYMGPGPFGSKQKRR